MGRPGCRRTTTARTAARLPWRDAIAYSKNAATVRLLEEVGVGSVKKVLRDLGIDEEVEDDLSIALGTSNLTLLDLVKGFSAFANGGERVKPVMIRRIEDDQGNVLEEHGPEKASVIDGLVAFKMNTLLKGVTTYGTAKAASRLGYPVAGKTGTTNSFYDALFVGYSPHLCAGVWVGFDQRTSLGKAESGGRVALPIWMRFMATALQKVPPRRFCAAGPSRVAHAARNAARNAGRRPALYKSSLFLRYRETISHDTSLACVVLPHGTRLIFKDSCEKNHMKRLVHAFFS